MLPLVADVDDKDEVDGRSGNRKRHCNHQRWWLATLPLRLRHPRAKQERSDVAETLGSIPERSGRSPAVQATNLIAGHGGSGASASSPARGGQVPEWILRSRSTPASRVFRLHWDDEGEAGRRQSPTSQKRKSARSMTGPSIHAARLVALSYTRSSPRTCRTSRRCRSHHGEVLALRAFVAGVALHQRLAAAVGGERLGVGGLLRGGVGEQRGRRRGLARRPRPRSDVLGQLLGALLIVALEGDGLARRLAARP